MDSATRYETPDPTPVDIPFGFTYESLADTIGRMVKVENLKQKAKEDYVESFAESQDFGEDPDEFTSRHELTELHEEMPSEWLTEGPSASEEAAHAAAAAPPATPLPADNGAPTAPPATP